MGKKIWLSMHPRNFCSDKTVRTVFTYVHPFIEAGVNFCILRSPSVSAVNRMDTRLDTTLEKESIAFTANDKVDKFSK